MHPKWSIGHNERASGYYCNYDASNRIWAPRERISQRCWMPRERERAQSFTQDLDMRQRNDKMGSYLTRHVYAALFFGIHVCFSLLNNAIHHGAIHNAWKTSENARTRREEERRERTWEMSNARWERKDALYQRPEWYASSICVSEVRRRVMCPSGIALLHASFISSLIGQPVWRDAWGEWEVSEWRREQESIHSVREEKQQEESWKEASSKRNHRIERTSCWFCVDVSDGQSPHLYMVYAFVLFCWVS